MPSDVLLKTMNLAHRMIRGVSFGHIGWTVLGMATVELTTTGRRTGNPHTVLLTSPITVDGHLVIVASRGGDDHHPAWFLNLRDNRAVQVRIAGRDPAPMTARIMTSAERAEVWPKITAAHPHYAGYQARTDREIPLVVLEPESRTREGY